MFDTVDAQAVRKGRFSKGGRVLIFLVVAIIAFTAGFRALLSSWSPGTVGPVLDGNGQPVPGAVAEKIFVRINGYEQGMFIRSADLNNPVLLFVHGGPGMPEYFLDEIHPSGMERHFTVCWWEQRGAGLSYTPGMRPEAITVDQLVSDTLAVTDYLRARFGKDKIYLMAHSWGSFLGIQAAARAPEKYYAYIGIAQIANQTESEKLAYDYMLDRYMNDDNEKKLRKLWKYPILTGDADILLSYFGSMLRDDSMHELGIGTTHAMKSVITGVFIPVWRSRAYTLREKSNIWRAKAFLAKSTDLRKRLLSSRIEDEIVNLNIPAYFLSGAYDYTVSRELSKRYLALLTAPVKGFYTFERSAHSPMFEEPERFLRILLSDVLEGKADLADRAD